MALREANTSMGPVNYKKSLEVQPDGKIHDLITTFNFNRYSTKKTMAQGFLDIALLATNVAQLRQILKRDDHDGLYYTLVTFVCISLALQVVAGGLIIYIGALKFHKRQIADKLNDILTGLLFLVSTVNVVVPIANAVTDEL